jgi:beta-galactosidase
MQLGACYFPEHWPERIWAEDALRMVAAGLSHVRLGEFAWSRIEPIPGEFDWAWLDRAVATLADAGLSIIMCTPTATPPKWLIDRMPDMVALDAQGQPRRFGSRRHYCFSHAGYRVEAARIAQAVTERYGQHPSVVAWQIDNEYGCHDTTLSFSIAARDGFRIWLAERHGDIGALNRAWGNVFWSMEYRSFDAVELPNGAVTEANPAHWLDFRRYSSDQVVAFNAAQVAVVRHSSPGRDIAHNFMGFYTGFDHHAVARDLDVAGWDSYPLGFLESFRFSEDDKIAYARQGHPDIAAFHHDLYRGCTPQGRWWVLEQQPGPVNWARYNPAPLPGMIRLWTLEAMAHGAELVAYFRWRQAPFGQEQMHAGLLRPDSIAAPALAEVRQAADDIAQLGRQDPPPKSVALIFSYESEWVTAIQPQGEGFSALWAAFTCYSTLRQLGLDIDIVSPDAALDAYAMVVVPCQPIVADALVDRLESFRGQIVIGPRSGSKTHDFAIPDGLPPGPLRRLFPATVSRVESLRPGVWHDGDGFRIEQWLEHIEGQAEAELVAHDRTVASWRHGRVRYLAAWPTAELAAMVLSRAARDAGLTTHDLPAGVRLRRTANRCFAFNYGSSPAEVPATVRGAVNLGSRTLPSAGVAVFG